MRIKGIKIDEDVARILNEQDNDDTSKYRVYYTNESINEAGKCTWHAWQEGKKYACIDDCTYGHIDDFIGMEEDIERFVKAGWVNANGEIVIPAGTEFQVRKLHTPNGIVLYFPDVDMELDTGLDEDDNTLYEIINESKFEASEGHVNPGDEVTVYGMRGTVKSYGSHPITGKAFYRVTLDNGLDVEAYAYVDLASEDWFTKHPYWEEDMPIEAYNKILKGAEEILGEKLRDDYYVESAKKANEQDNNFPEGSFAAWYGEDLTGQTYEGNLNCSHQNLRSLFGCPSTITGSFDCSWNQLTSLEGATKEVGKNFDCSNNKLTSLEGAPKEVRGYFDCSHNQLTSLEGAPKEVGSSFDCAHNELTSLEGAPKELRGYFSCSGNQLTSLEGAPKVVGDFSCSNNKLTSLEGAPKKVGWSFVCSDNQLDSLEGAPKEVRGDFDCSNNRLISLEGAPKEVGRDFDCYHNRLISLEGAPKEVGGYVDCSYNPDLESFEGLGEVGGEIYSDID